MAKIKFNITGLKITDSNSDVGKRVRNALISKLDKSPIKSNIDSLTQVLANFFYLKFLQSDTFVSMLHGELRAEFGFSDSYVTNLEDICQAISAVYLDYKITKSDKFLKIIIGVHDKNDIDYNEIGVYTTEKGEKIHWLYWLLTQGTTDVVPNYSVFTIQGAGRSHMAIMVQDDYTSYSIDPIFAGTEKDNWVTRILNQNKQEFLSIIKKHFNGT